LAAGFRPRFAGLGSRPKGRKSVWEGGRSEGAANRLRATQRGRRLVGGGLVDQVDETSVASVEQRRGADECVVSLVQMSATSASPARLFLGRRIRETRRAALDPG